MLWTDGPKNRVDVWKERASGPPPASASVIGSSGRHEDSQVQVDEVLAIRQLLRTVLLFFRSSSYWCGREDLNLHCLAATSS